MEGHEIMVYNAKTGKLPFSSGTVPKVRTRGIPIDSRGFPPGVPAVSSNEIKRILKPGGVWIDNDGIVYVKPT